MSRRTSMRAAPDCRPTQTAWHAQPPRTSTSHPPQQQDTVHSLIGPGTGKGASDEAGPPCCATRPASGLARGPPPSPTAPFPHPHMPRTPSNNNRMEEGQMSCRQQQAPPPRDAAKMSPHISIGPEPVLAAHAPSPPAAGSHCPAREDFSSPLRNRIFQ